jgi:UrcA family protein
MKSRINMCSIALLAGATLLSTGAMASPLSERVLTRTETVKYNPAKATTINGAAELYEKLHAAAAKVCSSDDRRFSALDMQDTYEKCTATALDKAVAKVHSPLVMALHLQGRSMKLAPTRRDAAIAKR